MVHGLFRGLRERPLAGLLFACCVLLPAGAGPIHASDTATEEPAAVDLEGRVVDPFAAGEARAIVLVFAHTTCPISNRYAPEYRRIHDTFAPRGVTFWLVYPDGSESADAIGEHVRAYDYPGGVLRDPTQTLVRRTGATVTPEAAVFTRNGRMVYRGRIDDRYVAFGEYRPEPTTHDLADALEATLDGKPVVHATLPAIGCYIPAPAGLEGQP